MSTILYREALREDIPFLARIRAKNSGTEEGWTNRITGYLEGTIHPQQALPPRVLYVAVDPSSATLAPGSVREAGEIGENFMEVQSGGVFRGGIDGNPGGDEPASGGAIIGFIAGHLTRRLECEGELEWIDVVEGYRRAGIASELVRVLAKWFIKQSVHKICVDPGDEAARKFYRNNGAEDLNQHWMYWGDIRGIF